MTFLAIKSSLIIEIFVLSNLHMTLNLTERIKIRYVFISFNFYDFLLNNCYATGMLSLLYKTALHMFRGRFTANLILSVKMNIVIDRSYITVVLRI